MGALASANLVVRFLCELAALAAQGAHLLPHGMSVLEEQLCGLTGLRAALPDPGLVKSVNSKIYSRRVAAELGLPQARGWECESAQEFADVAGQARESIAAGRKVGVKDAFGVSGKGIAVIEDERRLDQLVRQLAGRRRAGVLLGRLQLQHHELRLHRRRDARGRCQHQHQHARDQSKISHAAPSIATRTK